VNGKIVAGGIVVTSLIAGGVMYWLQVYAYYSPVIFVPGNEIRLTPIIGDVPEAIVVADVQGIDADSSPLRFRACFTTPLTLATLTETYKVYDKAEPTIAPGWFSCFNAGEIADALESGEALAFLSESSVAPQIDRVVAVFPDGRAFAWHQLHPGSE